VVVPSFLWFVRLFVRLAVCSLVRSCARLFDRSSNLSFVRSFVRLFVSSFACSFIRLFVGLSLLLRLIFLFMSLDIDANIVRHSRKDVVNDIEKHPNLLPKVMKMVPRRVPGPPFWGPRGSLDLPFEPLWVPSGSHLGPQCPPGRFWRISDVIWEPILSPKSMKFGVDFRCVFGMLFGGVLEWFWGCFG